MNPASENLNQNGKKVDKSRRSSITRGRRSVGRRSIAGLAMTNEETKPGADDELIERQIQEYEAYKQRLEEECSEWNRIAKDETDACNELIDRKYDAIRYEECRFTMEETNFFESKPNYSKIIKKMEQKTLKLPSKIEEILVESQLLDEYLIKLKKIADEKIDTFVEENKSPHVASSSELINRLAELR